MQFSFKKALPHIAMIIGFVVVSLVYFNPVLQGKAIFQSDIMQYTGMAKQQNDFREATGEETYWTNSAFGGMPTYQLGAKYPHNYIKKLDHTIRFLPRPADYLFIYLLSFYTLLLVLKVDYKLAGLGALAFGFSTYLIIILGVGHNAKAHAIAYMPLVLAGIIATFQKRYLFGSLLTAVALGLELSANHFQMTYYLMLLVLVLGAVYLFDAYKKSQLPHFFKSVGLLLGSVVLAIALNASNIMATQEYVKVSERGPSELTINHDGSAKEETSGLDRDYITTYSYGKIESFNLFIPRFMGGGTLEDVGTNSATFDAYRKLGANALQAQEGAKEAPMYWGDQPIVEAPAYVGAVVLFLFVLALFLVKGRLKWWLVGGTLLSLLLSFGKNLSFLTDLFIDYFPLYNKFRAVSSIQVILELCIPVLAIFGLHRILNDFEKDEEKFKALKMTAIITGGLALLFILFRGVFDFVGVRDGQYIQAYGPDFISAIKADRKAIYTEDTIRTLVLVLLSAGMIWMFLKKKLSENRVILAFALLILFDLVTVDRRYVNENNFVSAIQVRKPYTPNEADNQILKDKSHYRVLDVTTGNTRPNYFHNSLGGYSAAKMQRFTNLNDFHISKNNIEVLNMLNTKYIIAKGEEGQPVVYDNPDANGNAWFINEISPVISVDSEIMSLDSLDSKSTVILNKLEFGDYFDTEYFQGYKVDSLASITLQEFSPKYLKYQSNNSNDGFAVFSENYYGNGWQAFIDGKEVRHIRVNYVLRGMKIPAGNHTIEFKFEPQVVKTGSTISLASSILIGLMVLGGFFIKFRKEKEIYSVEE